MAVRITSTLASHFPRRGKTIPFKAANLLKRDATTSLRNGRNYCKMQGHDKEQLSTANKYFREGL